MTGERSRDVVRLPCWVGGREVTDGPSFDKISPVDGSLVATVTEAGQETVDTAVDAARRALDAGWATSPVGQRAALLRRIADRIDERFDDLVAAEMRDTGKPLSLVRELDVARAAMNFRSFADTIAAEGMDSYLTDLADGRKALNYAVNKPVGVVAVIVPWNLPLLLLTWKVAPALACGNAVVVKPSEETPSSATLLAEIMAEAGVPDGVYNVVHGFGPGSAGELITTHRGIDAVTFTGETSTGSAIMRAVAPRVRPVSFELGGKNPALVFADTDLERTLDGLARSTFLNTGQVCLATERIYVERPIFDDVAAGLAERARNLRLGRPEDPATTTGPLISVGHRTKVQSYLDLAVSEGAEVLTGGGVPALGAELAGGAWIEPTLWTGLDNTHRTVREEIFGPVAALIPFDDEEEAVRLANDTDYGLAAAVWTQNLERGHRVAQRMRVGMAWVNTWYLRDLRSPFGGTGLSGIGREGGRHSLHFYSEPTNVCIQL
ncbi:2-hydroxymuconic semialdehyde dehydrogenase [Nocardioides sp. SLBN-35]|jgi:aminomuconate-semialdehyde/2-hydroxymuconate-6-semialdehyde dehydrogenase|uniref:2-hydroxymuconic semialdehyde dehydrogenase n=1 Tax=Nocardioides sp. SLBN-35 TaxID=2768445 RepID=UPI001154422C|nr:2-hydroxymuconic semialdehyde dehydrogenase [Nocardioides sp. SLBN-35]TQK68926.1 aminomuconate-semialdehyde/2-hydroxymuconate-6-semialdehyde dehydrogenase [Nocardioides sp. SLBN-35]